MGEWQPIDTAPVADLIKVRPSDCLVYGLKIGVKMGRAWRYADGRAHGQADGFNGDWEITHWQPLPEPPK